MLAAPFIPDQISEPVLKPFIWESMAFKTSINELKSALFQLVKQHGEIRDIHELLIIPKFEKKRNLVTKTDENDNVKIKP